MIGGEDMYKPMCRECYHQVAEDIARKEADHESKASGEEEVTLRKITTPTPNEEGISREDQSSGASTPEKND